MKNKVFLLTIGIIGLFAAVFGAYNFLSQQNRFNNIENISPTITPILNLNLSPTDKTDVSTGWTLFNSKALGFSIRHPDEVEVITTQQGVVSFIMIGPTQSQGTELFDGFNVTISKGIYSPTNYENFRGFVEEERQNKSKDPATQSVSALAPVTIAGKEGFQFEQNALGDYTHIYLPTISNEYLLISKIVADPGNLGFEETINKMLSTLTN